MGEDADGIPEEEGPPADEETMDIYPRRDGAAARRELLFREGIEERESRYPPGIAPPVPVERSDLEAFDARYRGRNAQILPDTEPGLTVDSSVSASFQIDSNPLLLSSEEALGQDQAAWGFIVEPRLSVRRRTARTILQSVVRLRYDELNRFEGNGDDDLGAFDQYFGAQLDVVGRYNAFNVFTNVANATSRTALVEETGPGLTDDNTLTYGGGGSYKHALTANSVIQLSGAIRRQDVDSIEFDDSTFYRAAADYRTLVTATGAFGVGGIFERFSPDGIVNPNVDVVTALLSWSQDISPYVSFYAEAGAQLIDSEELFPIRDSESKVDAFAEVRVYWAASERDSFLFSARRAVEPTARGEVRTDNRFDIAYQRVLTRNISLGVPLTFIYQDEVIEDTFDNRTFFEFAPILAWGFAPAWDFSVEYRFRLDDEDDLSTATSNAGFLSVTYFGRLLP